MKLKQIILFCALGASTQIMAQGDIITDRPDQTEAPNAVAPGVLQIETGFLFERYEIAKNISQHRNVYPTNLFRIGLVKNLELRVVNEIVSYRTVNSTGNTEDFTIQGTENMQIGFKYQLTADDSRFVMGLMSHVIVPTGSRGISNERYGVLGRLNISYDIDDKRNISGNFGYINENMEFEKEGLVRRTDGNFVYTLAYGQGLSEKLGVYLEFYGDHVEFKEWDHNMDAGITYLLKPNLQLDYSYGWGLSSVMNYHSVGVSIRLPK